MIREQQSLLKETKMEDAAKHLFIQLNERRIGWTTTR